MRAILKQVVGLLAVYVIALQAVLGVWAGAAQAGTPVDPLAVLCRTVSDSQTTPEQTPSSHRVDCVCASSCTHMAMGALGNAAPLPSSPAIAVAFRAPVLIAAERSVVRHGSAQPRAPPMDV